MLGQLFISLLRLWSTVCLDNPTGAVSPPRSRTWHYHFQLIQQPFNSATWRGGLFLFHKDHLTLVLCKPPLIQELTISVSELQFCSLFPVSFSKCRWPLQPQAVAAPLYLLQTRERPTAEMKELGIFFSKESTFWCNSCHLIDRLT